MNIFYFDECPVKSAEAQPDKMLVKMPLETAQMLCTAHRMLDHCEVKLVPSKSGKRMVKRYVLDDERENILYASAYINHPCTVWARQSSGNYEWLYVHFLALGMEYNYRYGKEHSSITDLAKSLMQLPKNIHKGDMTPLAQAMPDEYKNDNPVKAYRNYVIHEKHYAEWNQNRERPTWWT
jgi:hypothetical protein